MFDTRSFDTRSFDTRSWFMGVVDALAAWMGAYGIQNLRVGGAVVSKAYLGSVQVI